MSSGRRYAALAASAEAKNIPLSVTFEIIQSCNLACLHCYNFDRELLHHPDASRTEGLSAQEIHRVIDEVRAEGALFLAFTGGEPLSHPRLEAFVEHAARAGMFVRLKSNGTLLTAERAGNLARRGLQAADVSVYGASAATHDALVKREGAWERTLAGVRAARDAGLEVRLSFVLTAANEHEAGAMTAMAQDLRVLCRFDTHITARYDGSRSSLNLSLNARALERLYRGPLAEFAVATGSGTRKIACPCARSVCGIGANGDVYPCIGAPLPAGNLRRNSFRGIWRDSPVFARIRALRNADFPACHTCNHLAFCRRSSGVLLNNTGEFTGPARFGADLCCTEAAIIHRLADERASGLVLAVRREGKSPGGRDPALPPR